MVTHVHFNDNYPQFKNIAITNKRTNEAHLYDAATKKFNVVDKKEFIEDVVEHRVCDVEDSYHKYTNELRPRTIEKIELLIANIGDDPHTKRKINRLIFNNT
jgi:ASC-1-like (ASCH) protein